MIRSSSSDRVSTWRTPRVRLVFGLGLLLITAAIVVVGVGWRRSADRPLNILIITLDTIRADRLPAYGGRTLRTPAIDDLAKRGVLFERAIASAPLTLPSHATIFSGLYPLTHGVRDNGNDVVPKDVPLLADLARRAGYRTGAFLGAFVLDGRWGLNRGFETYFDDFDLHQPDLVSIGDIRRPANEVVDRAIVWLRQVRDQPFVLWAHLYDPHAPYDPPAPYREEYASEPYLAEIAFADAQIGRLLAAIDEAGVRGRTAVVFVGDHGESFGDHRETGHGLFVYETTLRVPLVVAVPRGPQDVRRRELVSLVDLFPTMCGWLKVQVPGQPAGRSLAPLLGGGGTWGADPVYSETLYPRLHFGWSELAAYVDGRYKLIESSDPEVYDLSADPTEERNLADVDPARLASMRRQLAALTRALNRPRIGVRAPVDVEAQRRLSSLGYVTGTALPSPDASGRLPAPSEKIAVYNDLTRSREVAEDGDLDGAAAIVESIVRSDSGVVDAWATLGTLRLKQGKLEAARAAFGEGLRRKPDEPLLVVGLAQSQIRAGMLDDARKTLLAARPLMASDPRVTYLLGSVEVQQDHPDVAARYFGETLRLNPKSAVALAELAGIAERGGDAKAAIDHANRALALDPRVRGAHFYRGQVLERDGRVAEAMDEYRKELTLSSNDVRTVYAMARLSAKAGQPQEQEPRLRQVIEAAPGFVPAYLDLAKLYLDRGTRYNEAIALAQKALSLHPKGRDLPLTYFLLADLYNRVGEQGRSAEHARRGQQAARH